jgi:hypothetical protein
VNTAAVSDGFTVLENSADAADKDSAGWSPLALLLYNTQLALTCFNLYIPHVTHFAAESLTPQHLTTERYRYERSLTRTTAFATDAW